MAYDVVIVGASPPALRPDPSEELIADRRVIVLERARSRGAHLLSGALMDPRALTELLPDWKARGAPLEQPAIATSCPDPLGERIAAHFGFPRPPHFHIDGCYVVDLAMW